MNRLDIHLILNELKRKLAKQEAEVVRTKEKIKKYKSRLMWGKKEEKI